MWEAEVEKFGAFFGTQFDDEALDNIMFTHIRHEKREKLSEIERGLAQSKWFDYRFMPPTLATYLYAKAYDDVLREMFRRHIDSSRARYVKAFKTQDPLKDTAVRTGLWKGRQIADALCMPYPLYIEIVMETALRIKRNYLPRPQQLYSQPLVDAAGAAWEERLEARYWAGEDRRFTNDAYQGAPAQDAHRAWVIGQIARRGYSEHLLARAVWQDQNLTEQSALLNFGDELVTKARKIAGR